MSTLTPIVGTRSRVGSKFTGRNRVHATTFDVMATQMDIPVRTVCGRELYPELVYLGSQWVKFRMRYLQAGAYSDVCAACAKRTESAA